MVSINLRGMLRLVDEGEYPVVLTKVTEKDTPRGTSIGFQATIKDSDTDFDGRPLYSNHTISNAKDADNSTTLYYLGMTLLAFGADDDNLEEDFDPVELGKTLYGNKAMAKVVHNPDKNDPDKVYANATFFPRADDF